MVQFNMSGHQSIGCEMMTMPKKEEPSENNAAKEEQLKLTQFLLQNATKLIDALIKQNKNGRLTN